METLVRQINEAIRSLFDDVNSRYHLKSTCPPLFNCCREFVLRPGKRVRPLLFVLAYLGYSRRAVRAKSRLFTAAASIELLHDFMLIHDDVIDNSDLRRGKPTLHRMFDKTIRLSDGSSIGAALAIAAGDIVFALAIESFLAINEDFPRKERALKKLIETAAHTGTGEFIDIVYGHKKIEEMREKDIALTYILKTARYTFECPMLMGAILAGAKATELKKISLLGLSAGQAFQIYDDFLDLFATEDVIGKPVLTDLNESKKTLLVYKAYRALKGRDKETFRGILEKNVKTMADLARFKELIVASGAYGECLAEMTSLQEKAVSLCRGLSMKKEFREDLEILITKLSPGAMPIKL